MALNCVITNCTSKSSNYIQCSGGCGRSIHAACAGYNRSMSSASPPAWRNICEDCFSEFSTTTRLCSLEKALKEQGDVLAEALTFVKKAMSRMDIRDEHIDDLERSMQQSVDSGAISAVSVIGTKIDQLLLKTALHSQCSETIDLTPLTTKLDLLATRVTQDVSEVSRAVTTRLDTVELLVGEMRKKLDKPSINFTEASCQTDPHLSKTTASVLCQTSVEVDDVVIEEESVLSEYDEALSLQDELDIHSSPLLTWDEVECLAELYTTFNVFPSLPRHSSLLVSLYVVTCDAPIVPKSKKSKKKAELKRRNADHETCIA